MRIALIQTCASDVPARNLEATSALIREAAAQGAELALTPEVTNMVTFSRKLQAEVLKPEAEDESLAGYRALAAELGIWILVGSLALKAPPEPEFPKGRFVNRSFLIDAAGGIVARYDKIHMFDVEVGEGESYRESAAYRPGEQAVVADTPWGRIGMTICYDLRFPVLYRALAEAGAEILTIPSAFTQPTGKAHWEPLMRARAIETGCFVLAPASTGTHPMIAVTEGRQRKTYGHSLAVAPWGEVLADADEAVGATLVDLDLSAVAEARSRVPSIANARDFAKP
ncbi:carbon-nitrogen hydrolase family protein [Albimonas sp. CAU 1670]|uniref:carbon-nitrogen hydrolase family protein n=1 Tax=Albimonas sp. CAU 1670 TaxID=3032599 RepID=UPI0023DB41BA|nr:carbon-nitrogen hydrolase family protein [Albimonas sp. CAU 1670]MDF2232288.1 carbon-nitrogen hydrolase family protein [Albimonas sp. CAU 1670]